jgi:hypothetical protein
MKKAVIALITLAVVLAVFKLYDDYRIIHLRTTSYER